MLVTNNRFSPSWRRAMLDEGVLEIHIAEHADALSKLRASANLLTGAWRNDDDSDGIRTISARHVAIGRARTHAWAATDGELHREANSVALRVDAGRARGAGGAVTVRQLPWLDRLPVIRIQRLAEKLLSCIPATPSHLTRAMNATYAYGYARFSRSLTRAERIARLDKLATLLDVALPDSVHEVPVRRRRPDRSRAGLRRRRHHRRCRSGSCTRRIRLGVPKTVLARMLGNVAIDGMIGVVPVAGDVFDVLWRANRRNVRILREHLEREERWR